MQRSLKVFEVNFDGLVGPTHHYAGLAYGNVASSNNKARLANPKLAAQQGLAKMKALRDTGLLQGILPPQHRPDIATLKRLGFSGSDAQIVRQAARQAPTLLASCYSASSMWAANAATVSPSADTADGKVHITPANLISQFHRALERPTTARLLQCIFSDCRYFVHHPALPSTPHFGDEGAANHTRFCSDYAQPGVACFVYGRHGFANCQLAPQRFPARQTLAACQAIARQHLLDPAKVVYAQQNPDVIDQGVFHNDVIAVGNGNVLFCHEQSFAKQQQVYQQLKQAYAADDFTLIEVPDRAISVQQAVNTYLFNSQLVNTADGKMLLVVPAECREVADVWHYVQALIAADDNPITAVRVFDLRQSMKNGGGPACLRLRVVLTAQELAAIHPQVLLDEPLFQTLNAWIEQHYRDVLSADDLADPQLLVESRTALDELTNLLDLGAIYPFQQ